VKLYYIQDARSYVGNSVLWWRKEGQGYTCNLDEAEKVESTWVGRSTDKLWPCNEIDALVYPQFDMQLLKQVKYEPRTS
jgi:hypothetical protein